MFDLPTVPVLSNSVPSCQSSPCVNAAVSCGYSATTSAVYPGVFGAAGVLLSASATAGCSPSLQAPNAPAVPTKPSADSAIMAADARERRSDLRRRDVRDDDEGNDMAISVVCQLLREKAGEADASACSTHSRSSRRRMMRSES